MVFALSKILLFLIKPLVWVILIFLISIFTKRLWLKKRLPIIGLALLLFFSNEFIIGKVFNWYEPPLVQSSKKYDVAIILGGFSGVNEKDSTITFNWAADRLFQAISLYRNGKIKQLLISGGNASLIDNKIKEADIVANYLREINIPDSAILVENQSRNTAENASYSYQLIHKSNLKSKILVVTSAWHIPRTKRVFSKYFGDNVDYYPTNYIGKRKYDWSNYLVPSSIALNNWELILKEWTAIMVDRLKG